MPSIYIFVKYLVKPLHCDYAVYVIVSSSLYVHYCVDVLYARNNEQLVLGYVVAQLDVEREWSYQVGHGSCGLYVRKGLQDRIHVSIAPLLPLEGRIQIHRTHKMLRKVTNHSKTLKS